MQSRLLDLRFYLGSRIRKVDISEDLRMELLEILCLVDPDVDYQEFGLDGAELKTHSLELISMPESEVKVSLVQSHRDGDGCWECGLAWGHEVWCLRGAGVDSSERSCTGRSKCGLECGRVVGVVDSFPGHLIVSAARLSNGLTGRDTRFWAFRAEEGLCFLPTTDFILEESQQTGWIPLRRLFCGFMLELAPPVMNYGNGKGKGKGKGKGGSGGKGKGKGKGRPEEDPQRERAREAERQRAREAERQREEVRAEVGRLRARVRAMEEEKVAEERRRRRAEEHQVREAERQREVERQRVIVVDTDPPIVGGVAVAPAPPAPARPQTPPTAPAVPTAPSIGELVSVFLFSGFLFSLLGRISYGLRECNVRMITTDAEMESPSSLELEWREDNFLLPAPPEMPVTQWSSSGALEVVAAPLSNYLIDTAQGNWTVGPVLRCGEQEETEEIWGNIVSLQRSQTQTVSTLRQWVPRLRTMGEGMVSLQNVLRAVCERVTQLQEGVQREDRGLRELQQWAATQNNGVARRLQFLYQQFMQFGPQMEVLGQGYQEMQLAYRAGLEEMQVQARQKEG